MNVGKTIVSALLAASLVPPVWAKTEWAPNEKKFVFLRHDTQAHFWLSAGGTFTGTQVFRSFGLSLGPSVLLSAAGVFSVGVAKEYLHDPQVSKNDLAADALGVALGSLASFTIRFDGYFGDKQEKYPPKVERRDGPSDGLAPTQDVIGR